MHCVCFEPNTSWPTSNAISAWNCVQKLKAKKCPRCFICVSILFHHDIQTNKTYQKIKCSIFHQCMDGIRMDDSYNINQSHARSPSTHMKNENQVCPLTTCKSKTQFRVPPPRSQRMDCSTATFSCRCFWKGSKSLSKCGRISTHEGVEP